MLYLSKKDIQNLGVTMTQITNAVDEGLHLKGSHKVQMPPKSLIHPAMDSFVHAMPAYIEGSRICGVKWISTFPGNVAHGLPHVNGLIILTDTSTGIPMAVMDCAEITATRTGAMVGIAAKYLARTDSSVVGILGCGVQARKSLIALMDVLPKLSLVRCYDIVHAAAEEFVKDMEEEFPLTSFVICDSPEDMAHFSDVVITATPVIDNPKPSLHAGMLKEGALGIALDYDAAWTTGAMRECDKLITDDLEQLLFTKQLGVRLSDMPDDIYADLGEIVAGVKPGRQSESERILCLNLGIALADIAAAQVLYDRAIRQGIGLKLPI